MISIERLYSRQCPKSLNAEQTPKGAKPLTLDDILNIIGQVQHHHMIGSFVLDAKIALDTVARYRLVGALHCQLISTGIVDALAFAMAETAVHEVVDTCRCDKCNGTGQSYSRKYNKFYECKRCNGTGRNIPTHDSLAAIINSMLPTDLRMTQRDFQKRYYDTYMDCVNALHSAAGDASRYAKELLRRIEGDWAGLDN
uniref:hypothetical protein n=1 Tax=Rheinheimera sp. TaxID=1869214 RepID=UPI004047CAD9